jgi:hypothetical protein
MPIDILKENKTMTNEYIMGVVMMMMVSKITMTTVIIVSK